MATPRHSNQSYKYHPVEDPFPAQSKKSATKGVGKILCLQRAERGTDANDDANGFRVPKTSRDKNRSHSSSEGKMKVKDMLGYRDYASRNKIRTETKATDSKPRQAKTRTNSKAAPKHVQPMVQNKRAQDAPSVPSTVSLGIEAVMTAPTTSMTTSTVSSSSKEKGERYLRSRFFNEDLAWQAVSSETKSKEDPPTTQDKTIQGLEDQINQLELTLDVYRMQAKLHCSEIANLRKGTANLKSQLFSQSASRASYISEFKNTRKQLVSSNITRKAVEERLAMEIIQLKSENAQLRARGDRAIQILKKAQTKGKSEPMK